MGPGMILHQSSKVKQETKPHIFKGNIFSFILIVIFVQCQQKVTNSVRF